MQKTPRFSSALAMIFMASASIAFAQQTEKSVAFVTAEKKYVTTATGGGLDLSGVKIGSKQVFTLIDLNGGEVADGDDVQIRYTPTPKPGEQPKPNFWCDKKGELKRGSQQDKFKLKKTDKTFAIQAASGKFIGAPASEGATLGFVDSAEAALKVEIVNAPAITPKPAASAAVSPAAAEKSSGDSM